MAQNEFKQMVAQEIAKRVQGNDLIGVGTGTTVEYAVQAIGVRIQRENLNVSAVPTSFETAWLCEKVGMEVVYPGYHGSLTWGFDGADAVDDQLWAVKGCGGAMLKEKIMAARCQHYVLIIDESKLVPDISVCPVPVEVVPDALALVEKGLVKLGASSVVLRTGAGKHGPVVTEAGNLIIDAKFPRITRSLPEEIKGLVGAVESGLFLGFAKEVLVGTSSGLRTLIARS